MHDDVEFPQAVCSDTKPHEPHRIIGTWRSTCPGRTTAEATGLPADEGPACIDGCVTEGGITTCADECPRFVAVAAANAPAARSIEVGDRVRGRDVTMGSTVEGAVTGILYPRGLGYYQDEPIDGPTDSRRYHITADDGRTRIVECAERVEPPAAPEPGEMSQEERDRHSSGYWERTTANLPRVPAFEASESARRPVEISVARARADKTAEMARLAGHPAEQIEVTEREDGAVAEVVVSGRYETIQVIYRNTRGSRCRVWAQRHMFGKGTALRVGDIPRAIRSASPAEQRAGSGSVEPVTGPAPDTVVTVDGEGDVEYRIVRYDTPGAWVLIVPAANRPSSTRGAKWVQPDKVCPVVIDATAEDADGRKLGDVQGELP